jgi:hypothetical protein
MNTAGGADKSPAALSAALPFKLRVKVRDAAVWIGGMVAGALVGTGVQAVLARTGVLGPGVESLISDQQANFAAVNAKLDTLRQLSSDAEAQRAVAELGKLLEQQSALAGRAEQQLKLMASEVSASKDRELAERGMSGGADFWLKAGESLNLGARDQVFGLQAYARGVSVVNLSGTPRQLSVGDVIEFMAGEQACKVFFKQATPREDGRVGFDLDCS